MKFLGVPTPRVLQMALQYGKVDFEKNKYIDFMQVHSYIQYGKSIPSMEVPLDDMTPSKLRMNYIRSAEN